MKIISRNTYIYLILVFFGVLIGTDIGNFKEYVKQDRLVETRTYSGYLEYKLIPDLNMRIYGDRFGGPIMEAMINSDMSFRKEKGLNDLTAIPELECKDKEKEEYVTKIGECYVRAYKEELISELNQKKQSYTNLQNAKILFKDLFKFITSTDSSCYVVWLAWAYFLYPKRDEELGESESESESESEEAKEKSWKK